MKFCMLEAFCYRGLVHNFDGETYSTNVLCILNQRQGWAERKTETRIGQSHGLGAAKHPSSLTGGWRLFACCSCCQLAVCAYYALILVFMFFLSSQYRGCDHFVRSLMLVIGQIFSVAVGNLCMHACMHLLCILDLVYVQLKIVYKNKGGSDTVYIPVHKSTQPSSLFACKMR